MNLFLIAILVYCISALLFDIFLCMNFDRVEAYYGTYSELSEAEVEQKFYDMRCIAYIPILNTLLCFYATYILIRNNI